MNDSAETGIEFQNHRIPYTYSGPSCQVFFEPKTTTALMPFCHKTRLIPIKFFNNPQDLLDSAREGP